LPNEGLDRGHHLIAIDIGLLQQLVFGIVDRDEAACRKLRIQLFQQMMWHDAVGAGAEKQGRDADRCQMVRPVHTGDRSQSFRQPAQGGSAQDELRADVVDGEVALKAHGVGGQHIVGEGQIGAAGSGRVETAKPDQASNRRRDTDGRLAETVMHEADERRCQSHPLDPVCQPRCGGEGDQPSRRVPDQVKGRARVREHEGVEKPFEVPFIVGEAPDIAAPGVVQEPVRPSLSAPVKCCHPKTGFCQVANGLVIFFDRLVAALQKHNRAIGGLGGRPENRIAYPLAVIGFEKPGLGILGRGVSRRFVQDRGAHGWLSGCSL